MAADKVRLSGSKLLNRAAEQIPGGVGVAEVRHLEDHLLHVVRVGADLELAHLKGVR